MDIELLATTAVKERISYCVGLSPYVNEREKEPLWDGHIYVYPNSNNKKAELIARVPVQIKGKMVKVHKKKSKLSYPIGVDDLKKYFNDGGLIYFVVALEDKRKKIFYKCLLPYDIDKILVNSDVNKSKNITLRELPDNEDSISELKSVIFCLRYLRVKKFVSARTCALI